MEVIKRYRNRKLYSTTLNTYITLNDVLGYVVAGRKFQVINHTTKENITKDTIASCISKLDIPQGRLEQFIRGEL